MRETLNNLLVFHNNLAVKGITMTPEEFQRFFAQQGIELSAQQMQQFAQYYEFLVAENEKMNLTAITQEQEVYLKHYCLLCLLRICALNRCACVMWELVRVFRLYH